MCSGRLDSVPLHLSHMTDRFYIADWREKKEIGGEQSDRSIKSKYEMLKKN